MNLSLPRASSSWQLQDAKAHFSAVVRQAETYGPQHISVARKTSCGGAVTVGFSTPTGRFPQTQFYRIDKGLAPGGPGFRAKSKHHPHSPQRANASKTACSE